jgi:squalene-hopene/tetraprenyl-beta-curcumene cyclase
MRTQSVIADLTRSAIRYLLRDRSRGFPNAAHRMIFYHRKGFTGATALQSGDVFARSLIADALCDARDAGAPNLTEILDSECVYLVDQRQRSDWGGWSYFPGLPELPADVDVLAEVMQVLIRCGCTADLRAHAEPPLNTVLRDCVRPNGAIGTWIIPEANTSDLAARQARFVELAWGDTDDVEVIANFLFTLTLYDHLRFDAILRRASPVVRDRQAADGSWQSTWYVGPYYGTYVCSRALAALGDELALHRARSFLVNTQREDGGWGNGLICSQLGTALALCALSVIAQRLGATPFDSEQMERGVEALARALALRGGWHASPFIRMNVGRPRGEDGQELLYRSCAITAAYVLKAAVAVGRLHGGESLTPGAMALG